MRSVLRIAWLANYELSWRQAGKTWHDDAVRIFHALATARQLQV
ncbi:hypothetical protein [Paraburkholderia fynbosensis]|uniref:Uncharacterized protein n=1 Tax=Paraburkholderia fynbosensis TaxID=1200993 RepID=A0A6J5G1V5_9BURK|nr:hypothetical protein [Paraburkholderia fynbosensis]CAB3789253.1 hypothetical protein LMG27177_02619 [Paraburkholderia fynbosensis]